MNEHENHIVAEEGVESAACPGCGVRVTSQTPSLFYVHHDERCAGPLDEPVWASPHDEA